MIVQFLSPTVEMSSVWVGIIHSDNDNSDSPAFAFEGTEAEMRAFVKTNYKKEDGNTTVGIEDDNFDPNPHGGFSIYDLNAYEHLHVYKFDELQKLQSGGKRKRRQTRRRR